MIEIQFKQIPKIVKTELVEIKMENTIVAQIKPRESLIPTRFVMLETNRFFTITDIRNILQKMIEIDNEV